LGWSESLIHTLDRDLGKTGTEMGASSEGWHDQWELSPTWVRVKAQ
jgi:hypothetical protein